MITPTDCACSAHIVMLHANVKSVAIVRVRERAYKSSSARARSQEFAHEDCCMHA